MPEKEQKTIFIVLEFFLILVVISSMMYVAWEVKKIKEKDYCTLCEELYGETCTMFVFRNFEFNNKTINQNPVREIDGKRPVIVWR